MIMNAFLRHLTPRSLFTSSHVCSALCAVCVFTGTHNYWLALAASFALLCLISAASAAVWVITEHQVAISEHESPMDHRKVSMPEPRQQSRRCTTTAPGFICHPLLFLLGGILGAHLALIILYAFTTALFGFNEPRW